MIACILNILKITFLIKFKFQDLFGNVASILVHMFENLQVEYFPSCIFMALFQIIFKNGIGDFHFLKDDTVTLWDCEARDMGPETELVGSSHGVRVPVR